MKEIVQSWIDRSNYDLDAAKVMLESRYNLYVFFCCQQALEKALKAVLLERTETMPPRIHNLLSTPVHKFGNVFC